MAGIMIVDNFNNCTIYNKKDIICDIKYIYMLQINLNEVEIGISNKF